MGARPPRNRFRTKALSHSLNGWNQRPATARRQPWHSRQHLSYRWKHALPNLLRARQLPFHRSQQPDRPSTQLSRKALCPHRLPHGGKRLRPANRHFREQRLHCKMARLLRSSNRRKQWLPSASNTPPISSPLPQKRPTAIGCYRPQSAQRRSFWSPAEPICTGNIRNCRLRWTKAGYILPPSRRLPYPW